MLLAMTSTRLHPSGSWREVELRAFLENEFSEPELVAVGSFAPSRFG
jgi:hypothetical protein